MPKLAAKFARRPSPPPAGLTRPMRPSPELAPIVGAKPLARSAIVSKVWEHIRAHGLQDPANRRVIVADDTLRPIIGERCSMFELPGVLGRHLTVAA